MSTLYSGGLGYRGLFAVYYDDAWQFIPCSGEGPFMRPTAITPQVVHGSTDDSSAYQIQYAEGQVTYRGDVTFPFYSNATFWELLKTWGQTERTAQKQVLFSPDGVLFYGYTDCFVSRLVISGNSGSNNEITVTLGLEATNRQTADGSAGTLTMAGGMSGVSSLSLNGIYASAAISGQATASLLNLAPVPYWKSVFTMSNFFGADKNIAVDWSVTVNNNTQTTHVANNSKEPFVIKQGQAEVTGSTTLYDVNGVPEPTTRSGAIALSIYGGSTYTLTMGNVFVEDYPYPMRGPNEKTTRSLTYRGFAGNYDGSAMTQAAVRFS